MDLPYIHVDGNHVAMPQTDPFTILVYEISTGDVEKIKIQTKDGTLFLRWSNKDGPYKSRQAERPESQRKLIDELNKELEKLRQRGYILAIKKPDGDEPANMKKPTKRSDTTRPRRDKMNYYLDIAETVASRATCLRRRYGAIIVKDNQIIATGYNGAPRGLENCSDLGYCMRQQNNIPHGERYEQCRAIHAEMNAMLSASRTDMIGQALYLVGLEDEGYVTNAEPCLMCTRLIVNAGIETVVVRKDKTEYSVLSRNELIQRLERMDVT